MANTGDELGRRGGAHFASEKHCMKSSDRECNYDKQWKEDSCWICAKSQSTWIMPKGNVWILLCWGLGGWGSVGLLRTEPEHCQSMFFTWLLASLYFMTCERFSSKNFFPNLWKARFSHNSKYNFMEYCTRGGGLATGSLLPVTLVDQCNTKVQFISCFLASVIQSLKGGSETRTFTWILKCRSSPLAPILAVHKVLPVCSTTHQTTQTANGKKQTLLGIIHLNCKAASWIRSDESHPRSCCGRKQWVTSRDSPLHHRPLVSDDESPAYEDCCQDQMKLEHV